MKIILTFIPIVLLCSCLPQRLVPHDYSIEENNYESFIEVDSVTIALHNLEVKSDYYVFWMEVENNSNYPISIDLDQIRKYADASSYRTSHELKMQQEVITAMSLQQVNQFFKKKEQEAKAAAAVLFLVGAAISTYNAVKDDEDHRKEYWTKKDQSKSVTRDILTSTTLIATDVLTEAAFAGGEKAHIERKYLPKELFDKEVIHPGQRFQGKILFRKHVEPQQHHRLVCPVDGENWFFDFRKATPKERRFLYENRQ